VRGALLALSLAAFASVASMRAADSMLPRLASDFGVGIAAVASVVTVFTLVYGAMQVVYGPLGDRFGKLHVIAWGCAAAAVASFACFLSEDLRTLVIARAVAGAFCASVIPLAMAWIGDVVEYRDRQPVLARFLLGQIFAVALASTLGGFAADRGLWRWPFVVLAACFVVASLALLRIVGQEQHKARPVVVAAGPSVFRSAWARVVVTTAFIEGVVVFGVLAFIPTHLNLTRGVPLSQAGLALVAYAIGGALFAFFARPVVQRIGERGLVIGGTALLSLGLVVISLSPGVLVAAAGCLVAGLGFYAFHNTLQTNATQMAPSRRGAAMALFASLFFFGQSAGVAAAGFLVERYGTTAVLLGAAIAMIPLGITFAQLLRSRPTLQPV
jgi:predicted MFS family arabinose efflux permease